MTTILRKHACRKMRDESFDILSINESRLDANIARDTVRIQGYDMVAKHRNREGGGVELYYRSTLTSTSTSPRK
jgi:hypothetical protein